MQAVKIFVLFAFACIFLFLWKNRAINPVGYFSGILENICRKCNEFFDFSSRQNAISMVIILTLIILLASLFLGKIFKFRA